MSSFLSVHTSHAYNSRDQIWHFSFLTLVEIVSFRSVTTLFIFTNQTPQSRCVFLLPWTGLARRSTQVCVIDGVGYGLTFAC